jgi:hypothetical protein
MLPILVMFTGFENVTNIGDVYGFLRMLPILVMCTANVDVTNTVDVVFRSG